jgi:hypothetical protein
LSCADRVPLLLGVGGVRYAQLERLWRRADVAVREKALWRLLYETAARAEVLSLDVGDVDVDVDVERSYAARAATSSCCTLRPARRACCRA